MAKFAVFGDSILDKYSFIIQIESHLKHQFQLL